MTKAKAAAFPGNERRSDDARSTGSLALDLLISRPAVWAAAILTAGVAIVVGTRISPLFAPIAGAAALLVAVSLTTLYDAVSVGRRGISIRSRAVRPRTLKALIAAVVIASLAAGVLLLLFVVAHRFFELG